tara:strand:- start:2773 stop:3204 length:432 start_codon:yes stop_codon:yes gene_type:complete
MPNLQDFFTLDNYINITFFVNKKKNKSGASFFVVSLDSDDDCSDEVALHTRWKYLNWDSKNVILTSSKVFDPINSEMAYDPILYKDNLIKECLISWMSSEDDDDVYKKVDKEFINKLPFEVVERLLYFYEKAIASEEESLGKV